MAVDRQWESGFRPEWEPLQENEKQAAGSSNGKSGRKGAFGKRKPRSSAVPESPQMGAPAQAPLPPVAAQGSGAQQILVPGGPGPQPGPRRGPSDGGRERSSSIWPALAGAFGTALVFALCVLAWVLLSGDDPEVEIAAVGSAPTSVAETFGPTVDDMELGAEQLRVMLRGMNLSGVSVEVRESVLYLVGTVPNDASFADAVLAAGALPSVNHVNFTELQSEQSSGFTIEEDEPETEVDEINVATASLEDRQALQAEIDEILLEIPIRFDAGDSEPDDLAGAVLQTAMVSLLEDYPGTLIMLAGYTDERGSADDNLRLSQQRADAVKSLLMERGIAEWRLVAVGRGSTNSTGDEDLDRRVEIEVVLE